jgi:dolichol-phosphate mannosyltransferase
MTLLVLVPALNEQENIEATIRRIAASLPDANILIIDDDSTDGTWQTAESLIPEFPQLDVMVRRGVPAGLGYSILDGYRYALKNEFDELCIVDCDLQQSPDDVQLLQEGDADITIGSRYLRAESVTAGYDRLSNLLSKTSNFGLRLMFLFPCKDVTTDFFLMKTDVLRCIDPAMFTSTGYGLFAEVKLRAYRAGFSIREVAVPTFVRENGHSKRTFKQVKVFAKQLLALWANLVILRRNPKVVRSRKTKVKVVALNEVTSG